VLAPGSAHPFLIGYFILAQLLIHCKRQSDRLIDVVIFLAPQAAKKSNIVASIGKLKIAMQQG